MQELVTRLYDFNSHYFESHDISSAHNKAGDVAHMLAETLEEVHLLEGGCHWHSQLEFLV